MHKMIAGLCAALLITAGCVSAKSAGPVRPPAASFAAKSMYSENTEQCLRHVVLFKWKDGTPPETINEIEQAFQALPSQIPQILALEWGTDMSVENLAQGFSHCFLVSFKNENDRAVYLPHPAHKAFGQLIGPHLDKVLVFDFWAQR